MTHDIRLGYLAFEVRDLAAWEPFAVDVLGLEVGARGEKTLDLRCDDRAARFFLTEGPGDDVAAFGWEVDDEAALDALTERLLTGGVDVHAGTDEEARRRGVTRLMKLNDPTGHPLEIFHGAERAKTPFVSRHVVSSFVTGSQGLGHVVVSAAEPERSMAFYRDLLGFRLSDRIACDIHGYAVDITFFHGGPRHHSVAIGGPQRKRVHHFMLEVASMDDVGLAFDRALRGGVRITQTLGRHPNDRMFSFYAKTPSGFHFEYGWGGRTVDDATWKPTTYDHISEWGHQAPEMLAPRPRTTTTTEKTNEHTAGTGGEVRRDR
jgi:2,3-dihydroxybiphenyl 1,2-dioxygenase